MEKDKCGLTPVREEMTSEHPFYATLPQTRSMSYIREQSLVQFSKQSPSLSFVHQVTESTVDTRESAAQCVASLCTNQSSELHDCRCFLARSCTITTRSLTRSIDASMLLILRIPGQVMTLA